MTFYRAERGEREETFKFAKFHSKTPEQSKAGKWIENYYKFSLPKDIFDGKNKQFKGYFGYFHSEVPSENIMMEFEKMDCTRS